MNPTTSYMILFIFMN